MITIQAVVLLCHLSVQGFGCGVQYRNYDLVGWSYHHPKEITSVVQVDGRLRLEKDVNSTIQYLRTQFKVRPNERQKEIQAAG